MKGKPFGEQVTGYDAFDGRGYALSGDSDFDGDGFADLAVAARVDERPSSFSGAYANPNDCPGFIGSAGSVVVHRGGPGGVSEDIAFVFYGIDGSAQMREVASGLDFNGDGFDDLVASGRDWGTTGGVALLRGRPAADAGITVLCNEEVWEGLGRNDRMGESVAVLGDLDGDGCDEFAVGASLEDTEASNQGIVRVLWGYGPACATNAAEMVALGPGINTTFAGESLAGGGDVDGDKVPDLAVGATEFRVGSDEVGAAWVVPGSYLLSLPRQSAAGRCPAAEDTVVHPLVPSRRSVRGPGPPLRRPISAGPVALIEDPAQPERMAVAVGVPLGEEGGTPFAGGVLVYRFDPGSQALASLPFAVVGGEGHIAGGEFGHRIWRASADGEPRLLIGAPLSSQQGLQVGGGYVVSLR